MVVSISAQREMCKSKEKIYMPALVENVESSDALLRYPI